MALNQFCGVFAMINFTASIFKESGSNFSPNVSSIIVGAIQIIGSMMPTLLVDRLGRKVMMGTSAFGTSIGLCVLGCYSMLKFQGFDVETVNWIPLVTFSFVIFISNCGLMTLPFMILSELTSSKVGCDQ
jgi:MFS family permease